MKFCCWSRMLPVCACTLLVLSLIGNASAQKLDLSDLPAVVTHENVKPAGTLNDGLLTVHLTFKEGAWHPDADDGPAIPVLAFAEEGGPPNVPGPLIRVPEGTRIHAYLHNAQAYPMVVHGLHQRPGDAKDMVTLKPGETKELNFLAGAPGSYFYWASSFMEVPLDARPTADTQMTGAFIVDPRGAKTDDKVMVLGLWYNWLAPLDFNRKHGFHEILTVNGKSFPYTERLTYTAGDTIHWRVLNPSVAAHPMHLHGAFFRVDSAGDGEKDVIYPPDQQRLVVTELMQPGRTMAVTWTPQHAGNWIFHCHLVAHMDGIVAREPGLIAGVSQEPEGHAEHAGDMADMAAMKGMAGLVVPITVNPRPGVVPAKFTSAHKLTMILSRAPKDGPAAPPIRVEVRDGNNTVATVDGTEVGPPIILHRDEPTEITVVNHLASPTAIHWHGIELESYYDGVPHYGGNLSQVTPPIAAGESFVVRMTPPRAGTFIYHTHWHDAMQLLSGLYGALIVLEPGQKYDPEHDRVYVVGRQGVPNGGLLTNPLLVNGVANPAEQEMSLGEKYRLRFINITPNDDGVELKLLNGTAAAHWQPIAKDGADLPASQAKSCEAKQIFAPGETYDFEVVPETAGNMKLSVEFLNFHPTVAIRVAEAKVMTKK